MATFREVNIVGETIWLNIENVVWIGKTEDGKTPVKIVSGDIVQVVEDREEFLSDWDVLCAENVTNEPEKQ